MNKYLWLILILILPLGRTLAQTDYLPIGNHLQKQWTPTNGQVTVALQLTKDGNSLAYAFSGLAHFETYPTYKQYVLNTSNKLLGLARARTQGSVVSNLSYSVKLILGGIRYDFGSSLGELESVRPENMTANLLDFEQVIITNVQRFMVINGWGGAGLDIATNGVAIISGANLTGASRVRYLVTVNGETNIYTQTGDRLLPAVLSLCRNPPALIIQVSDGADTTLERSFDLVTWEPIEWFGWWQKTNSFSLDLSDESLRWYSGWWWYDDWDYVWRENWVWWSYDPDNPEDGEWIDEGWYEEVYRPPPPVPAVWFFRARSE